MAMTTRLSLEWMSVVTTSPTERFVPATDWIPTAGVSAARGWVEIRAVDGTLAVAAAVQMANNPDTPASHVTVQAPVYAEGPSNPDGTHTAVLSQGYRYIRGGFAISTATGLASGRVGGIVELYDD